MSSDELYHFGIKGMRWGVRRYQNEDGTLTPAGQKRYRRMMNSQFISYDKKMRMIKEIDDAYSREYFKRKNKEDKIRSSIRDDINKNPSIIKKNKRLSELQQYAPKSEDISRFKEWMRDTKEGKEYYDLSHELQKERNDLYQKALKDKKIPEFTQRLTNPYYKNRGIKHSIQDNNELYHFGILGMKWGRRRYQNEDGSLTDAGRKRYGTRENFENDLHRRRARDKAMSDYAFSKSVKQGKGKEDISRAEKIFKDSRSGFDSTSSALRKIDRLNKGSKPKKSNPKIDKELKSMSNQDIQDYLRRADLERQYRQIREPERQSGLQKAADVLDVFGDVSQSVIATAAAATILYNGAKTLKKFKK